MSEPATNAKVAKQARPFQGVTSVDAVIDDEDAKQQEAVREKIAKAAAQKVVPHLSVSEREAKGKAARALVSREALGAWQAPPDRTDPVDLLASQETSRVQELVPVRHARMATSAFAFYRGGALLMAADLATMPRSGVNVQLCGDAHLANFGLFAAPDRSVVFDVNDFDETHPGPFEWDVKRLAASFVLAARDSGLPDALGREAASAVAASYRQSIADFASKRELEIWYNRVDASGILAYADKLAASDADAKKGKKKDAKKGKAKGNVKAKGTDRGAPPVDMRLARATVEGAVAKARTRDAWSAIQKITEVVDGRRQFRDQPPLLTRLALDSGAQAAINSLFREYRATLQDDRQELLKRYEIVDMGHKVVGVGSVGLLAFVMLLRGRDEDDLMVLQVKQAQASVLEAFTRKSAFNKHGHRVVTGQRLMQAASDSFLGWIDGPGGRSFYIRQLRDMKWSPDPSTLTGERLARYGALCGHTLARAHARSGDAVALASYLGSGTAFDKAVADFSMSYAAQVAEDYATFTAAIASGRIEAHEDAGGAEGIRAAQQIASQPAKPKRSSKAPARAK
jgi:uncharacterized protein (DUF2252 family)